MPTDRGDFDRKIHRALAHPLRVRILEIARERDEISPVDLAGELDEPLGVVSYHVRTLARAGLLDLIERTFRRGAVKHHYRATPELGMTVRVRVPAASVGRVTERIRAVVDAADRDGSGDVELTVVVHHGTVTNGG